MNERYLGGKNQKWKEKRKKAIEIIITVDGFFVWNPESELSHGGQDLI